MTPFDRWQVEAGLSLLSDEELVAGWWQCTACARVNQPGEPCRCEPVTQGVVAYFEAEPAADEDDTPVLVLRNGPRATL